MIHRCCSKMSICPPEFVIMRFGCSAKANYQLLFIALYSVDLRLAVIQDRSQLASNTGLISQYCN